jgi:hypothetical protein
MYGNVKKTAKNLNKNNIPWDNDNKNIGDGVYALVSRKNRRKTTIP